MGIGAGMNKQWTIVGLGMLATGCYSGLGSDADTEGSGVTETEGQDAGEEGSGGTMGLSLIHI